MADLLVYDGFYDGFDHYGSQTAGSRLTNCLFIMEKNSTVSENDRESTGNALKSDGYPLTRC